jgi:hypothetical protein
MCFIFLNACLYIYNISMRLLFREVAPSRPGMERGHYSLVSERYSFRKKDVLQYGIRAKVSTLSLDGPVEWSLDRGFEEKLCLEDQFRTFECS